MKFILVCLLIALPAFAGEVISFKAYAQKKKSCAKWLAQGENPAKVLTFASRDPEYLDSKTFLNEMDIEARNIFYLYSTGMPDFSRSSQKLWHSLPQISNQKDIYILKVSGFDGNFLEKFESRRTWKISGIREEARMISFTKIRVHPLFSVMKLLVEQVRGIECHNKNMEYRAPQLLDEEALSQGSDKVKMVRFLNSWVPINLNEESIKEAAKAFVANEFEKYEQRKSVESFLAFMEQELLRLYTPEQVYSVLSYLSGR